MATAATTMLNTTPPMLQDSEARTSPSLHQTQGLVAPFTGDSGDNNFIQASPYASFDHLLDLRRLEKPYQLMAKALTVMQNTTEAYATTAYPEAFNWDEVAFKLHQIAQNEDFEFPDTGFYVIVFRSRIPKTTSRAHLGDLDAAAHIEAVKSGGLLKYWFGTPNEDGRNLATCVWRDSSDAKLGGAGKGHAQAMREVRGLYLEWKVERLRLQVSANATSWSITNWVD